MVKLNLDELLKKENKSIYWLSKQLDKTPQNTSKLVYGETTSINFQTLSNLKQVFKNYSFDEILTYTEDKKS